MALCVETGEPAVEQGARRITPTAVWVAEGAKFRKLEAGLGACDPAWSPDGRRLAVTSTDGLWIFPAESSVGSRKVTVRLPPGKPSEFTYRAFSQPAWSPDSVLVALLVSNGGTSWVEVFEATTGKLFYTSPPETYSVGWGETAQDLKAGDLEVRLPEHP